MPINFEVYELLMDNVKPFEKHLVGEALIWIEDYSFCKFLDMCVQYRRCTKQVADAIYDRAVIFVDGKEVVNYYCKFILCNRLGIPKYI